MSEYIEPVRNAYGNLTDTGYNALMVRALTAVKDSTPVSHEDVADLVKMLTRLGHVMNVRVMADGYHFLVGTSGEVLALTAGDQHYEDAGLKLDMFGWEALDDNNDPAKLSEESWESRWKWTHEGKPPVGEIVVTKTAGRKMEWDWTEYPDPSYDIAHFAENAGPAQFWMSRKDFEMMAPQWAKDAVAPLDDETIAEHARRFPASPGVAEKVS